MFLPVSPLLVAGLTVFLFLVLCAALVLVVVSLRSPATTPLVIAVSLVVAGTVVVAISPVNVPVLFGLVLGLLAVALAVIGGNPITRRMLDVAAGQRVRETPDGGIVLLRRDGEVQQTLMRGGTTIGYLERTGVVLAIIAGFPEAIAVVVAVKGIGRFSELGEPETRERFIIGTLASLVWACVIGALVRLAIW